MKKFTASIVLAICLFATTPAVDADTSPVNGSSTQLVTYYCVPGVNGAARVVELGEALRWAWGDPGSVPRNLAVRGVREHFIATGIISDGTGPECSGLPEVRIVLPLVAGSADGPGEIYLLDFLADRGVDTSGMSNGQIIAAWDAEVEAYLRGIVKAYRDFLAKAAAEGEAPGDFEEEE